MEEVFDLPYQPYHRVTIVKNQPPDFEQLNHAHEELTDAETITHPLSVYCARTALKLYYVAKGLKYRLEAAGTLRMNFFCR